MINWLKRNWLKIFIGIIALIFIYSAMDSIVTRITYKKRIREKDASISELQQGIKESENKVTELARTAQEWYARAMEKEELMAKKDKEIAKEKREKKRLEEKIWEMPAPQVVVRTIEIIKCEEIHQQEQGIVFSLSCARENLTVLEDSFSMRKEADDWMGQYFTCKSEVSDLKNSLLAKDGVITEKSVQLGKKDGIIDDWKGKFTLSEKRGKRSWWKGAKTGGTIGIIAGTLLGLFLGGR